MAYTKGARQWKGVSRLQSGFEVGGRLEPKVPASGVVDGQDLGMCVCVGCLRVWSV